MFLSGQTRTRSRRFPTQEIIRPTLTNLILRGFAHSVNRPERTGPETAMTNGPGDSGRVARGDYVLGVDSGAGVSVGDGASVEVDVRGGAWVKVGRNVGVPVGGTGMIVSVGVAGAGVGVFVGVGSGVNGAAGLEVEIGSRIHEELGRAAGDRVRVVAQRPPLGEGENRVAVVGREAVLEDVDVADEAVHRALGDAEGAAVGLGAVEDVALDAVAGAAVGGEGDRPAAVVGDLDRVVLPSTPSRLMLAPPRAPLP